MHLPKRHQQSSSWEETSRLGLTYWNLTHRNKWRESSKTKDCSQTVTLPVSCTYCRSTCCCPKATELKRVEQKLSMSLMFGFIYILMDNHILLCEKSRQQLMELNILVKKFELSSNMHPFNTFSLAGGKYSSGGMPLHWASEPCQGYLWLSFKLFFVIRHGLEATTETNKLYYILCV